jgi:S-adenosylmethionine hydrolase
MMRNSKLVTFLSDFGTSAGYVGSVKGVIKNLAPEAEIIDISHEIPPFNILHAGYTLLNYYAYFPKDTIHLVVVDPGVGSDRRAMIIRTAHHTFVGPDNGVFQYLLTREAYTMYEIDVRKVSGGTKHYTFHGRDLFAPVVAKLLKGVAPDELGKHMENFTEIPPQLFSQEENILAIKPIAIDRFGNIIAGFSKYDLDRIHKAKISSVTTKNFKTAFINKYYAEKNPGELLALWNSQDFLEVAMNQGNAAHALQFDPNNDLIFIEVD